jgi:predicted Zn-dependent protease
MATAYAWVQRRGLRASTIDLYYAMLRHRPLDRFPGGQYRDILTALAIPKNANDDKAVDRLSLSLRTEAFAFILVHELGHVLFRHKGYDEITKQRARDDEVQSDRFALDVLARSATPPLGAVLYFQAQVYRFRHPGEFPTPLAFDDYLMKVATHPMTVDRIEAMARHISGSLADQRGHEREIWVGIGQQLARVADLLRDGDLARCIANVAAEAPWDVLRPGRSDQRGAMETACR